MFHAAQKLRTSRLWLQSQPERSGANCLPRQRGIEMPQLLSNGARCREQEIQGRFRELNIPNGNIAVAWNES
jgi:hypothetical protein